MALKTTDQIREEFLDELQSLAPQLSDTNEGSIVDSLSGAIAYAVGEVSRVTVDQFNKTFFDTANGPEVTGGPDDLQTLAVDHFGDDFARPAAIAATGVVTFSRASSAAGNCTIPAGTIVKTVPNTADVSIRFLTETEVVMTGLTINASVVAEDEGTDGNVQASKIIQIESTLTDSTITVNNSSAMAGGTNEENDSEYRETLRLLIKKIRGGTKEAIEAAAIAVDGVEQATAIETEKPVIDYDIAADSILSGAEFFRIPYVEVFVADANGSASQDIIDEVLVEVKKVRSEGIYIKVTGATAIELNWTASMALNVSGPNYVALAADPQLIIDSMTEYLQELLIGGDFIRATAEAAILAIWGPSGTNDLTAFTTSIPSGDVTTAATEKLVAGTVEIV